MLVFFSFHKGTSSYFACNCVILAGSPAQLGSVGYPIDQVDAAQAKAQRLGLAEGAAACPVSLELVEEYERYKKNFRLEIHSRTGGAGHLVEPRT
jgi:hypothetical protein